MKTNNLIFRFTLLTLLAGIFTGCSYEDDPVPQPPKPLRNAIEFAGTQTAINSWFEESDEAAEMEFIYLAADKDITASEQLTGSQREYVALGFGDLFYEHNSTQTTDEYERTAIDLMTLKAPFRITYAKEGKTLLDITNENRSAISAGMVTLTEYDEYDELEFSITLHDGTLFRGNVTLDEEENSQPELNENTLLLNGREIVIRSAFAEEYANFAAFTVSPAEGITSLAQIVPGETEYFQLVAIPSLLNTEFDPLTEQMPFSIISTLEGAACEIGVGTTGALVKGSCLFNLDQLDANILCHLTFADGTTLSVRAAGKMAAPMPEKENYIVRDGVRKPLRAAFFDQEDDMVMLWFTPGDIEWFEDISMATYFATMLVSMDALDGNTIELGASDRTFQIFLTDNSTEETKIISSDDLAGATGSFRIGWDEDAETTFDVDLNVTFGDGTTLEIDFNDECKWMGEEPVYPNEFTYDGETKEIRSAIVDKRSNPIWDIWVTDAEGITTVEEMKQHSPVHISCPGDAFYGEPVGFSTYDELYFEYAGKKWNAANGNIGTLSAYVYNGELELDFTNYEGLKGHYNGKATVITM